MRRRLAKKLFAAGRLTASLEYHYERRLEWRIFRKSIRRMDFLRSIRRMERSLGVADEASRRLGLTSKWAANEIRKANAVAHQASRLLAEDLRPECEGCGGPSTWFRGDGVALCDAFTEDDSRFDYDNKGDGR